MRLVDRLILKEIIGPWLFGVGLFSSLLFATTFLARLTSYIVDGVPTPTVLKILCLLLPAMLVQTFPMAVLLAALLSFGRLSSDSEIVALRASGVSIARIVAPVMGFSILVAIVSFAVGEGLVPRAGFEVTRLTNEVALSRAVKTSRPISDAKVIEGKVRAYVSARTVDIGSQALRGVTVVALDENERESFILTCKELEFHDVDDWRINGNADVVSLNNPPNQAPTVIHITNGAWPENLIPKVHGTIGEMLTKSKDAFDTMSMAELGRQIADVKARKSELFSTIANMEYGYWNKVSVPLAAFVFGTLGAVLGIRNHRTGTAAGFALAIGIIFGQVLLMNFMSYLAKGGLIPAYAASFTPTILGAFLALYLLWQRNK